MEYQQKDKYTFDDLIEIVKILRAPGGCPWDRAQTHKSIRSNFIEETYEAIEAIDTGDTELLREELGDVLMQVALHCEMEREAGSFDINDVCDGVCKKLIYRHPHVFGDVTAENPEQALNSWDAAKMKSKSQTTYSDAMRSISKALPALMRSEKIQKKASKVGFDWDNALGAMTKLTEECNELNVAIALGNSKNQLEEVGRGRSVHGRERGAFSRYRQRVCAGACLRKVRHALRDGGAACAGTRHQHERRLINAT